MNHFFILKFFTNYYSFTEGHLIHNSNFEYKNCFFIRLNIYQGTDLYDIGCGGAIYCNNSNIGIQIKLLNCIFYYCSSLNHGGAIFFISFKIGSNAEIKNICGNSCFAGKFPQFALINLETQSNNIFTFSSIINCSNNFIGETSLDLYYGNIN